MKTGASGINSHIQQETTTLCTCVKITRRDGTVFGFTDHDEDLVISGVTYKADSIYQRSASKNQSDMTVSTTETQGVISNDLITESDLRAHKFDGALVEIIVVNWADITQGTIRLPGSFLGEVTLKETEYTTELRGLADKLRARVGAVTQPTCRADLGDLQCTVDLSQYEQVGEVLGVTDNRVLIVSGVTAADDYFNGGLLTWTSGNNSGLSVEAKQWVDSTGTVTLFLPALLDIQIGDDFTITPGCNKLSTTCKNTFDNLKNMRAEIFLPGYDKVGQRPLIKIN